MSRPAPSSDSGVATTRELLDAALARSARRNARVARWRIAGRWTLWASGVLLRYGMILAAVAAPFVLGWYVWHGQSEPPRPTSTVAASAPGGAPAAESAASYPPGSQEAIAAPIELADSPASGAAAASSTAGVADPASPMTIDSATSAAAAASSASAPGLTRPRIDDGREADRPAGPSPRPVPSASAQTQASSPTGRLELRLDDSVTSDAASAAAQSTVKPTTRPRQAP